MTTRSMLGGIVLEQVSLDVLVAKDDVLPVNPTFEAQLGEMLNRFQLLSVGSTMALSGDTRISPRTPIS